MGVCCLGWFTRGGFAAGVHTPAILLRCPPLNLPLKGEGVLTQKGGRGRFLAALGMTARGARE